ncbi:MULTISPECIES: DUF3800 domain-containing protein [unclassified Bradyrhizobium]|uniref:DUF3800 domain-containing protein n=1 Tax=unclassified Bradyrhizobium TaxID=2631580 RepID=UPI001FFA7E21|nr:MULTISPECIES: DUF3800 domain-containing protein [unclassified Bradyrhizobium]MCK1538259.1 DUF3800 domain-containing protein [Bradyrhizobium sp. 176]MCK1560314.1 DUF3800 domain-containing protein [Bradyrhizobium sp. 171]
MIEVNELRKFDIALNELTGADATYTMYYDETNNIRRLHTRADGLNVREPKYFVIAGIAYRGPPRELNIDDLRQRCRIQKTTKDIKLEHIAKGDFLQLLAAQKLESFLRWVIEKGFAVHYSVMDPLYWSTVDIIDSILTEYEKHQLLPFHGQLKDALYTILRFNLADTVDLFRRYSYPDVGSQRRNDFISELRGRLEEREPLLGHFEYMMLKGVLQIAEKLDALPYLEDEQANVLVESFGPFYVGRICLFKNSHHILDVEKVIEEYLGAEVFMDGDRRLENFRFVVSHEEPGVQASDVIAGLLGKFFALVQVTDRDQLCSIRENLSNQQKTNLGLLKQLLDGSIAENKAFAHRVLSFEDQQRAAILLG